ncbi:AraC family transcriptional regulator [Liquorilactobacillus mali]|uniref:AraC family transcriptional regulator n=2 Tax=Liquorilactobacillus mali KCTC 3596 = DSM 20444 TaxID=1046596 RepID=J0UVA4_9LACO|nr:helix-turn-helix domain-containing protein [Liquorilactobacillus mali]AJA34070.1 AraC family transcriptional regulator [Liquorilactobacillus mali KCTC 3596 = DSM 20444]EJF02239.1 AraC family transcriptional regulator [Liquorilactobacillus mali KCTC 3596 = DSM 20444]MDC7953792.1 helix-turn-helix domain-containing protein [Liquorilactobacillus mali]MDV7757498.1 helix-turn-helix domain-containing protein [Liquorilactobacillus mali]QFQ75588.1 AraC family transcriptional regulator [Liquorilactob
MLNRRVMTMLRTLNPIETKQKQDECYLEEIPANTIERTGQTNSFKVLNNYFFKNKDIYISKHNRFAPYPTHSHTFLEINYMLEGRSVQSVDGEKIVLNSGDLLLLDVGATHSIGALGENDLLINILFRNSNINIDLLKDLRRSRSVLYDFLLRSSIKSNQKQDFLVFRTAKNYKISQIMDEIIEEYFLKREFSDTVIKSYLQILITNLVRNYRILENEPQSKTRRIMIEVLDEIDKNYTDINLKQVAAKYNYNKNYFSNLFKKEVGKSFSEIVLRKRLTQANVLITSTALPINQIAQAVGISNYSFFYKKYFEFYKELPAEQRKRGL